MPYYSWNDAFIDWNDFTVTWDGFYEDLSARTLAYQGATAPSPTFPGEKQNIISRIAGRTSGFKAAEEA